MRNDSHLLVEARQTAKAIHDGAYFDPPSAAADAGPWLGLSEEMFCAAAGRPSAEEEDEEDDAEDEEGCRAEGTGSDGNKDGEDSVSNLKSVRLMKTEPSAGCVVDLHDTSAYVCIVVDLETSGFSPSRDRVIQLGAALVPTASSPSANSMRDPLRRAVVKPESAFFGLCPSIALNTELSPSVPAAPSVVDPNDEIETFGTYIRPEEKFSISSAVTEVTGITKEKLIRDGVLFSEGWDRFGGWLRRVSSGKPIVLLAHNGKNFDFKFLHAELVRYDRVSDLQSLRIASFVDTLAVLRDKSLWRSAPVPSSFSLPELHLLLCGQPLRDAHDAGADSAAVARILSHAAIRDQWRAVANRKQYSSLLP
jgi:DNA polymerase III epsilon subunit-like protein